MQMSFSIFPLGDNALLVDFGNVIDVAINRRVMALFYRLQQNAHAAMEALVPAYSSLAVFYDVAALHQINDSISGFEQMADWVSKEALAIADAPETSNRTVRIPVCYSPVFGLDLEAVAAASELSVETLIQIHTATTYRVFMIGFLPGFAYMGEVPDTIAVPRKDQPRTAVPAGSVGIAGKQTGIYPVSSPGGWQIIGRTPLKLFEPEKEQPVLLQPGDLINFYPITEDEFAGY